MKQQFFDCLLYFKVKKQVVTCVANYHLSTLNADNQSPARKNQIVTHCLLRWDGVNENIL